MSAAFVTGGSGFIGAAATLGDWGQARGFRARERDKAHPGKARRDLDYQPVRSIPDGLAEMRDGATG